MTQQAPENEKKKLFSWFSKKPKSEPKSEPQEQPESHADRVAPSEAMPDISPELPPEVSPEVSPEQTESDAHDEPVETSVAQESSTADEDVNEPESIRENTEVLQSESDETNSPGFFQRLKVGLKNTREQLSGGLGDLFLGKKEIDDDLLEELETYLLMADVGVEATQHIIATLTDAVSRKELNDPQALLRALKTEMTAMLSEVAKPLEIPQQDTPFVILMVGVNGVGKTTTIGKLAKQFQQQGKSVMLAAGDTFRAAAVEQLEVWGERNNIPVVAQHTGADSASVIYDAVESAKARQVDILIADTAGRLHTHGNLMQELTKVKRVMAKLDANAPHEVLLVLDAGTGQNAVTQAKQFNEAVAVSGLVLTKLDGTAKGGVIFSIAQNLTIPVRYIGVGEQIDDLRPFEHEDFVAALFDGIESDE